ncbi:CLUMA_CG003864, isoform A [Clunio marinus]|uniref:CLUMA_CG003864, isoform A n=1 Tax=Clunio marinus TaxID=568069 RepID=A0A1J1HRY4_9DIPT|nr:CLUMA_CG003864, isoform A [Clunio marinus]
MSNRSFATSILHVTKMLKNVFSFPVYEQNKSLNVYLKGKEQTLSSSHISESCRFLWICVSMTSLIKIS